MWGTITKFSEFIVLQSIQFQLSIWITLVLFLEKRPRCVQRHVKFIFLTIRSYWSFVSFFSRNFLFIEMDYKCIRCFGGFHFVTRMITYLTVRLPCLIQDFIWVIVSLNRILFPPENLTTQFLCENLFSTTVLIVDKPFSIII